MFTFIPDEQYLHSKALELKLDVFGGVFLLTIP
jgi:hypothetical protein